MYMFKVNLLMPTVALWVHL